MSYYTYQRISFGGPLTPVVKSILIASGATFILQQLAGVKMLYIFGLIPLIVWKDLFLWQLVSYIFLHGDIFHLLFNLLALYMFGCELERIWGSRFFLRYFFITGIGAGISTVCLTPGMAIPTVGASGAIFGILLAYALYYPNRIVYFNFLFPIKIKYLVLIYGVLTFYFSFSRTGGNIAHIAHLGGMLFGFVYLKSNLFKTFLFQQILRLKFMWLRRRFRVIDRDNNDRDDDRRTFH
ncbi:MAG: rhomboid family intramembrane serine protease [Deltaproteobacteria bacterium]|nr:rhomboid family intramembrane serine protease [Deltaproteobacteria bacterium]